MAKLLEKLKNVGKEFRKTVEVDMRKINRIREMNERSKRAAEAAAARKG
ncbi:unnamed protein product [marine sediment metagenome]|uniref:Uncharacterized protein n=1 Tax=marine sediment metagenome TaxID=412755 RepID=X1N9G4_9ZZZZ